MTVHADLGDVGANRQQEEPRVRSRFLKDNAGGVAIIFGLTISVIAVAIAFAVDYTRALNVRTNLQEAADAGATAGAVAADSVAERTKAAQAAFIANAGRSLVSPPTPKITVQNNQVLVEAAVELPTPFGGLVGDKTSHVAVASAAQVKVDRLDVHLVVDMSESMGIGADATERQKLKNLTKPWIQLRDAGFKSTHPNGCAFACHTRVGYEPSGVTSYQTAKAAGIKMRGDVVLDLAKSFVDDVLDPADGLVTKGDVRLSVIGFSNDGRWLARPTKDLTTAKNALTLFPDSARMDTYLETVLPWVNTQTQSESGNRKRVVVLVTDGVRGGQNAGFKWSEVNTTYCNQIKNAGADLYVLELKYEEETGDSFFETYVRYFYPKVTPALQSCASPGKYTKVSTPTEIGTAFNQLAAQLAPKSIRLVR